MIRVDMATVMTILRSEFEYDIRKEALAEATVARETEDVRALRILSDICADGYEVRAYRVASAVFLKVACILRRFVCGPLQQVMAEYTDVFRIPAKFSVSLVGIDGVALSRLTALTHEVMVASVLADRLETTVPERSVYWRRRADVAIAEIESMASALVAGLDVSADAPHVRRTLTPF